MNSNKILSVDFKNNDGAVKANIVLICFKEVDTFIIYSPHLEVTGYGQSEKEALDSFNISLKIFLDYTINKNTLHEELISLGWELKKGTLKKPKKINAPSWTNLIKRNADLEDILNNKNITTTHREVAIPV